MKFIAYITISSVDTLVITTNCYFVSVVLSQKVCGDEKTKVDHDFGAEEFSNFFKEKATNICASTANTPPPIIPRRTSPNELMAFTLTTVEEVTRSIMMAPSKHCSLDIIPTWLMKDCCTDRAPFLTMLFDKSIASSDVPQTLKKAFNTSLSKKQNLNVDKLSNYRSVSNFSFISKQLEKVIASRLVSYLNDKNQSAYRRFHSTETSLLHLMFDLLSAAESGKLALMSLLDMSAALILSTMTYSSKNVIVHTKINWITSYLTGCTQSVKIDGST